MYLFPKLFKTYTHDTWLFVCLGGHHWSGQTAWQRVRKLFWFIYVNDGQKFFDWEDQFVSNEYCA